MKPYDDLTEQGQARRVRRLAEAALQAYPPPVRNAEMSLIKHSHNTTFRLDAGDKSYMLRVNRPGWRSREEIESEAVWLAALRRDTDLVVPQPVPAADGAFVVTAGARGVPQERDCLLFHWVEGQFYRKRLSPVAIERVGRLTAHLHNHVLHDFAPPPGFTRPSVQWGDEENPGDMARAMEAGLEAGGEVIGPGELATFTLARHRVQGVMDAVGYEPADYNLIHADIHHGNFLFEGESVHLIDFDDCGWGHLLYDIAVTRWYWQARPDYGELCAAQLEGYRQVRSLSAGEAALIPDFVAARTLMIGMYMATRAGEPGLGEQAPAYVARCAAALRDFVPTI